MKRVAKPPTPWTSITPAEAKGLDLTQRLDITTAHNSRNERCAWPWSAQVADPTLGKIRCEFCGEEVTAGSQHPNFVTLDEAWGDEVQRHRQSKTWTTFRDWHRQESLYREVYTRTASAVIAAFIVYAVAALFGYVTKTPLVAVILLLIGVTGARFLTFVVLAVRYRDYTGPLMSGKQPRFIPHPTPEQARAAHIVYSLYWSFIPLFWCGAVGLFLLLTR